MVTTKLNLSMTEPQVRQIYAKQGDTGRVLDITLDQTPEDGTLRILRPDGTEVTSEAVTGGEVSESGETVTFDSLTEADVTELTVGIEPVQDLNGYDAPWVGGAGKNKLVLLSESIKSLTSPSVWSGNVCTISGMTYTLNMGSGDNVTSITVNGTTTGYPMFPILISGLVEGQSYTLYRNSLRSRLLKDGTIVNDGSGNYTFTAESGEYRLVIFTGATTISNVTVQPMVCLSSESSTWQPYSNICPITGHDEVTVARTGENLLTAEPRTQPLTVQGVTVTPIDNWHFRLNGTCTTTTWISLGASSRNITLAPPLPNGTYTVSCGSDKIRVYVYADSDTNKTAIGNQLNSVTVNGTIGAIRLLMAGGQSFSNEDIYVQIVRGTTVPTWTPYQGSTYTTSLGQTVYGGSLDMVSGVLTVDKAMVDLGSLNWSKDSGFQFYAPLAGAKVADTPGRITAICSAYTLVGAGQTYAREQGFTIASNGNIYLYDAGQETATATEFKTAMDGVTCVYSLTEPVTYQLTAQQIKTLVGTNNVWAFSGDIISITFTYGGLLSELPSEATEIVGKCYCDVEQNGVSSMPFTLNVKKNERES